MDDRLNIFSKGFAELGREKNRLRLVFATTCIALAAIPLIPQFFGSGKTMDYPLWFWAGQQVLTGGELYAVAGKDDFPFLYPPLAAILLAPFSMTGYTFSVVCLTLIACASLGVCIYVSDRLAGEPGAKPNWVLMLPTVLSIAFVVDNFNLGQPHLLLTAIILCGFLFLLSRHHVLAGFMFALAVSLKFFPVAILPYLVWRRHWLASSIMVLATFVLLVLVPAPMRGFERNVQNLKTWAIGMGFSDSTDGFGQRAEQNWSWKNASLIAVVHRFARPLNVHAVDPGAKPYFVNVSELTFRQANYVFALFVFLIGLGFICVLPQHHRRSAKSDADELAILMCLITIASPLARTYYFVSMIFPITVLVYRGALADSSVVKSWTLALVAISMGLYAVGAVTVWSNLPQALGNNLWATFVITGALAFHLRRDRLKL